MSIDYSVSYYAKGFYPLTDSDASVWLNKLAANVGGWDVIRQMPLGAQTVLIDGKYYGLSIEGDLTSDVWCNFYDLSIGDSSDSFGHMGQIETDLNNANDSIGSNALDSFLGNTADFFGGLKEFGYLAVIGIFALAGLYIYLEKK